MVTNNWILWLQTLILVINLPGFNGRTKEHKNDLWCLDTDTWTWSLVTPPGLGPNPRRRQALVRVGDKIFLFGGTR